MGLHIEYSHTRDNIVMGKVKGHGGRSLPYLDGQGLGVAVEDPQGGALAHVYEGDGAVHGGGQQQGQVLHPHQLLYTRTRTHVSGSVGKRVRKGSSVRVFVYLGDPISVQGHARGRIVRLPTQYEKQD